MRNLVFGIFVVIPGIFGLLLLGIHFLYNKLSEKMRIRKIMRFAEIPKKIHEEAMSKVFDRVHVTNADKLKCPTCGAPVRKTYFTNANCIYCDTVIPELERAIAKQIEAERNQLEAEMLREYELKKAHYDYKTDSGRIEASKIRMVVIMAIVLFALFFIMMIYATR